MKKPSIGIIIVTHNSQEFLPQTLNCLSKQTYKNFEIIIVDSASSELSYLKKNEIEKKVKVVFSQKNIGFCEANNIGVEQLKDIHDYIFFLNPDCFLNPFFLEIAVDFMENKNNKNVGILTSPLLGFDIKTNKPNGRIDSLGIYRKWYGRWYDLGQGYSTVNTPLPQNQTHVSAICGALMFCRHEALKEVLINKREVFDNNFFMYKEDIDLSIRVKKKGWDLIINPRLSAYHCRGWKKNRKAMPKKARLISAKNEIRLCLKNNSPYILWAVFKFLYVVLYENKFISNES